MNILFVAPMPPSASAALAVPRVLNAAVVGLSERNRVTVAVVAGPEEHELEAVERLRAGGVDVHAVCRHPPRGFAERWSRRDRLARGWLRGRRPWRSVWYSEPGLQPMIDRLVSERRFDVIAVEDNAAATYRFPTATPVVFTEHEVRRPRAPRMPAGPARSWPRAALSELDWRRWPSYHRATWSRFDLIQAFTERDAEAIQAIAPEVAARVRVNPFGVVLPDPLPPAPEASRELIFAGNFTHPPNVDAAVWLGSEIMPRIRARGAHARLTIVGPWAPPAVTALAAEDVTVTGRVPEIRPYFERAAVVLAPIRIGGGMRMKVLEGLALARPVVTTPRGADGLAAQSGVHLEIADSADAFAAAAVRLLADPRARADMAERGRAFATEHHSAKAYARRLEAVYGEAIDRAAPERSG